MGKHKILIFSDCYIYGGSEKLMAFLLKNEILNENFIFLYGYRKYKGYEIGLKNEGLLGRNGNTKLACEKFEEARRTAKTEEAVKEELAE